jgi:hypothetical protein
MRLIKKHQMGGQMEDPNAAAMAGGAPAGDSMAAQGGEQDPMAMIVELFAQGLQAQDCNALAQGAQMFLQLVQEAQGGAEAAPEGQPVFAKGGKIVSHKQATLQLVRK